MENNRAYQSNVNNFKLRKIVYYILGIFETLFAFRLIFKLLGANPGSTFVSLIYTVSGEFLAPFSGIFSAAVNKGIETESVLEPTTVIAMVVYAVIANGVIKLLEIYTTPKDKKIQ